MRIGKREILFCEIHPICYGISLKKEILKRHIKDALSRERFASNKISHVLPNIVAHYSCDLIKRGKGIDLRLQENKAVNIKLACDRIDGMLVRPGEVFSFWHIVGKTSRKKGYRDGRVIIKGKLIPGLGGGLCNLGNTIHWLVLHSPLDVVEFHHHSDALAPDHGKRIPFSTGTSISYNYIDYRFKNTASQAVQLKTWCDEEKLYGELRSEYPFPWAYRLVEENHHFHKEGDKFFRISKIYREIMEQSTGSLIGKELILNNHSEVMFDYELIPKDQLR